MNVSWPDSDVTSSGGNEDLIAAHVWVLTSPLIFVIGFLGNSLSLAVFRRIGFGRSSTNVYLSCIATADNGVLLLGLLPQWLEESGVIILHDLCPMACKISYFCKFTSGDTSIWLLAAFTIDRAVAVRFPLRNFLPRRSRSVFALCSCVLACACAKNVHVFWTRGAVVDAVTGELISTCDRAPGYEYFEAYVRPWIAFAVVNVAPLIVILMCNAVIVRVLVRYHDRQRKNTILSNVERNFRQTTVMCLAVSVVFFVCVTPYFGLLIVRPYWKAAVSDRSALNVTEAVNNLLLYTNHSCNFFMYCLTGNVFRQALLAMLYGLFGRTISSKEDVNDGISRISARKLSLHDVTVTITANTMAGSNHI